MAQSADIREDLESAIKNIPDEVDARTIKVSWPAATFTVSSGKVTTRDIFGGKSCGGDVNILDVAARSATQSDGTAQISLNAFHCLDPRPMPGGGSLTYAYPITVLATPQAAGPVHLAVEAQIVVDAQGVPDVIITVRAWDTNGGPVSAAFNWRCTVPIPPGL
jgi:hypothetical protein